MNLVAGKYQGKLLDYCMTLTERGDPMVALQFEFGDEGYQLVWRGGLSHEKSKEITIKALKVLGFSGTVKDLATGPDSGALDTDKAVELDVVLEDYNGKQYAKIQWINEVGGGGFKNKLSVTEAVKACAGLNLDAEFAQAGISRATVARAPTTDEIPF